MGRGKRRSVKTVVVENDVAEHNKENEEQGQKQHHVEEEMEVDMMVVDSTSSEIITPAPRPSKFVEATMNSRSTIHPPPNDQWKALGIDHLMEGFSAENSAPPTRRNMLRMPSASAVSQSETAKEASAHEGVMGRFSRAVASFFGAGGGFSLGKRKAGSDAAERNNNIGPDQALNAVRAADAKERAEAAYAEAKARGLLPAPKVLVRPGARTPRPDLLTGTPTLYRSPSKKDLQKQKKLSKRVSDLEFKLAEARKELALTLSPAHGSANPVSSLPAHHYSSPFPTESPLRQAWIRPTTVEATPSKLEQHQQPTPSVKVVKKRKVTATSEEVDNEYDENEKDDDVSYKHMTTDSEFSHDSEFDMQQRTKHNPSSSSSTTKPKSKSKRRSTSSRLLARKSSTTSITVAVTEEQEEEVKQEQVFMVVPDARVGVPPLPSIPKGVDGKKSIVVNPDGYGGFEHEMF